MFCVILYAFYLVVSKIMYTFVIGKVDIVIIANRIWYYKDIQK